MHEESRLGKRNVFIWKSVFKRGCLTVRVSSIFPILLVKNKVNTPANQRPVFFHRAHERWQVWFFLKVVLPNFSFFFPLQKAKECYGKVLSGWFLFCGGREWVRQPDGRSLWFSRWLFCVVLSDTGQAHWHAASLPSISSPPLPSPPPPTESLLRRWIPAPPGPELQILRGWDGTCHLDLQRKCQCLGSYWWHPFATVKST